jgi:4-amino-4-deoxy-L-arabinose transferase-like glycosyltransferase
MHALLGLSVSLTFLILTVIGFCLYFLPSIIAFQRKHLRRNQILLLNLLLGWTLIGWVVSIVWSVGPDVEGSIANRAPTL